MKIMQTFMLILTWKNMILKAFDVKILPLKDPKIKEILWHLPIISWIQCNSDGANHSSIVIIARGVRYYQANILVLYDFVSETFH